MATTSQSKNWRIWWSRVLFSAVVFFTTNCFVDTWRSPFFLNNDYRLLKFLLAFLLPSAVTVIEYFNSHSFKFIGRATAVISASFVVMYLLDAVTLKWIACFGNFMIIYHLAYGLVSVWSVLITASVIKAMKRREHNHYTRLYNDFFIGEAIMLAFIFVLIYFVIRDYNNSADLNFVLFRGELKSTFESRSVAGLIRTLGNVLVYSAISLTVIRFFKGRKMLFGAIVPILISLFCEAFQYLTACGDADIDDVFTNTLGVLLGLLLYKLLFSKLLRRKL